MILDHFWKIVFFIALGVAGYFFWLQNEEKKIADYNISRMAELVNPNQFSHMTKPADFDSVVFQTLEFAHRLRESGENISTSIRDACERNGTDSRRAKLITRTIEDNLAICDVLGVFADGGENAEKMEVGDAPTVQNGAFAGDEVAVARLLSPLFAKEGLNDICNVQLTPETVRCLNDEVITSRVYEVASKLQYAGIISKPDFDRIRRMSHVAAKTY